MVWEAVSIALAWNSGASTIVYFSVCHTLTIESLMRLLHQQATMKFACISSRPWSCTQRTTLVYTTMSLCHFHRCERSASCHCQYYEYSWFELLLSRQGSAASRLHPSTWSAFLPLFSRVLDYTLCFDMHHTLFVTICGAAAGVNFILTVVTLWVQ